ncbi:MAG: HEAT repeat domain-containing protein [Planctomycetota bacterium]|jgi:hypothetical protein
MENKAVLLLVGAVFGAAVGVFVWSKAKTESSAHAARQTANVDAQNKLEDLEKQNADLTERLQDQLETINQLSEQIDELSRPSTGPDGATPTAPTEPGADLPPLTDEELEAGLKRFGEQLQSIILGHGDKAVEELKEMLKRAPKWRESVEAVFADAAGEIAPRYVAAHVMAQSGDPEALKTLEQVLRDPDRDRTEQRISAHALAFTDTKEVVPLLTEVARNGKEPGVRANASFGLARRGIDEGIDLYMQATDAAFEQGQPEAIAYLSGIPLIGEKAKPYVRERLTVYKNETALVSLIELTKQLKDKDAIEQLGKLAYDANQPKSVQNAAQGAIKVLSGE